MPALRGVNSMAPRTRRRSSLAFTPTKPGVYSPPLPQAAHHHQHHLSHLPPRPISFAPNVTPVSYNANSSDDELDDDSLHTPPPLSPGSQPKLFPPSDKPAPPTQRKRCPPGRRRSQGYIPRPPNAFMLFRADFVRQKHVPGSIETNHTSLSKIIGNCWRNLPLDEKKVWEHKAKIAKNDHKEAYPDYRFRPVHKKSKKLKAAMEASGARGATPSNTKAAKAAKAQETFEEEMRCEEVTQLLLQGLKGEELTVALHELEKRRNLGPIPPSFGGDSYTGSSAPFALEHDSAPSYGNQQQQQELMYAAPTQQMQQLQLQQDGGYGQDQDPYALHHPDAIFAGHHQLEGGMYAHGYSRGATPSTAASSVPYTAMSAPQPTYPSSSSSLFGANGLGGNGMGGNGLYMQRRPSSVPAIPTSFGGWGVDWDMGADDSSIPGYSFQNQQHHVQQQQQQGQEGVAPDQDGIALPSIPFLAPPSSAGLAPPISEFGMRRLSLVQRMALGHRRSSSAGAAFGGMRGQGWGFEGASGNGFAWPQTQGEIQRDDSELPEADLSLFNPSFLSTGSMGVGQGEGVAPNAVEQHEQHQQHQPTPSPPHPFTTTELYQHLPQAIGRAQELGPLDTHVSGMHGHHHSHSHHASVENVSTLQFQVNTFVSSQSADSQGAMGGAQGQGGMGKEGASPVERYEQMYLAEQDSYNVGAEYAVMGMGMGGYGECQWGASGYGGGV